MVRPASKANTGSPDRNQLSAVLEVRPQCVSAGLLDVAGRDMRDLHAAFQASSSERSCAASALRLRAGAPNYGSAAALRGTSRLHGDGPVQLLRILQDLAQAQGRRGRERADTIVNNDRAKIIGAGVSDAGRSRPWVDSSAT
jgi:hypothetical protein